jgi:hypothetical protein
MHHLPHGQNYHLPRLKEMGRIYWCHSIGGIAFSLATIFIPIYLINSGVSIQGVLLFMMAKFGLAAVFQYPIAKIMTKVRPHQMFVIGGGFTVIYFLLLASIEPSASNLAVIAIFWSLHHSIYWQAFHYVFGLSRAHEHSNRQIAKLDALVILTATIAPALGGVIATMFGISYTYLGAVILYIISILPMISKDDGPPAASLKLTREHLKKMKRDLFANFCAGTTQAAEAFIWPLFVFLVVSSYAGVGILSSIIAFASMLVTLYVGRKSDLKGEKPYINHGIFAYSLTNIGRLAAQNSAHIFGLNLLAGLGQSLFHSPYLSRYYHNSDGPERNGYIVAMEAMHGMGFVAITGVLFILSFFMSLKLVLSVGLATIAITAIGRRLIR